MAVPQGALGTSCPALWLEGVGMAAFIAGMVFTQTLSILSDPVLYEFRNNKTILFSVIFGAISCFLYPAFMFKFSSNMLSSSLDLNVLFYAMQVIIWSWVTYSFCIYIILFERSLPLFAISRTASKPTILFMKYGLPAILNLPQWIEGFIRASPSVNPALEERVMSVCEALGTFLNLIANTFLTYLFLRTLARNRGMDAIYTYIVENKRQSFKLILDNFLGFTLIIAKIVVYTNRDFDSNNVFFFFHNTLSPLIFITTFKNFIAVTRIMSKEILKNTIAVSPTVVDDGKKKSKSKCTTRSEA